MWLHLDLIGQLMRFARTLFPAVAYASGVVSTYPSGVIGYLLAGKNKVPFPSSSLLHVVSSLSCFLPLSASRCVRYCSFTALYCRIVI
jgi:hypothetical protein